MPGNGEPERSTISQDASDLAMREGTAAGPVQPDVTAAVDTASAEALQPEATVADGALAQEGETAGPSEGAMAAGLPRPGWFARAEQAIAPLVESAWSWLPLMLAISAGPGLFAWALRRGDFAFVFDNKLSHGARMGVLSTIGLSVAIAGLVYAGLGWWRWRRTGAEWTRTFRSVNAALLGLLALPLVMPLLVPKAEIDHPFFVAFVALALAAVAVAATYQIRALPTGRGSKLAWAGLGLAVAAYAGFFSWLAVLQHHGLSTATYDLGIYDNLFWQSIHGNPLGSSFVKSGSHVAAHVDPLLVLLSPLYLLYPRAEFLLVFQSIWLALGAIPLFWLARRSLGSPWVALAFALVYLLYPALHGANLYDFHSLSLAAPLLILVIAAMEAERPRLYAVALALLLLTREDMALLACFVGLYAIVSSRRTRLGLWTIGVSVAYFAFLKLFVMPDSSLLMQDSKEAYGYAYYYKDLIPHPTEGALGLVISLLINPIFTLVHAFTKAKVLFGLRLFLPLLFLPFFARGKVVLLYGLAFLFLSSRGAVHSLHFQYTVVLFPLAMALTPLALAELPRRRWFASLGLEPARAVRALAVGCLVATAAISAKYGAILPNDSFRGGFAKLVRSLTDEQRATHDWIREMVGRIPPDASVAATSKLGPHISNRQQAVVFPGSSDYALVDRKDLNERSRKRLDELRTEKGWRKIRLRGTLELWGPLGNDKEAPPDAETTVRPGVLREMPVQPDLQRSAPSGRLERFEARPLKLAAPDRE